MQELPLIYHDESMAVVNKPPGLLVHRSREATDRVTCLSILREQLGCYVYPIHRLDRKTSGLLVFGLNAHAARMLNRQFQERTVKKTYVAIVRGYLEDQCCRHPLDDKPARTELRSLAQSQLDIPTDRYSQSRFSLVEARPEGGFYHQVRRHCKRVNCPVLGDRRRGDSFYNRMVKERFGYEGMALHAQSLILTHPESERILELEVPPEQEFLKLEGQLHLRRNSPG